MNGSAEFIPPRMVARRDGGMNSALHASRFMESPDSLSRMHWDLHPLRIRSAGFPTGETRRLESRRYGVRFMEREHLQNLDVSQDHERERGIYSAADGGSARWRNEFRAPRFEVHEKVLSAAGGV